MLQIIINAVLALLLLLIFGSIIFTISIIIKPSKSSNFEKNANRILGLMFTFISLELSYSLLRFWFNLKLPNTRYLIGASAIFLFLIILGISTANGLPFLAKARLPLLKSKQRLLGLSYALLGISLFFLYINFGEFEFYGDVHLFSSMFGALISWLMIRSLIGNI